MSLAAQRLKKDYLIVIIIDLKTEIILFANISIEIKCWISEHIIL